MKDAGARISSTAAAPPSSESNNNHLHSLLSPPLQLHDEPATHFLSSLEPTSTELIFSPNNDHHEQQHSLSASPPPPSPTEYLDDPPSIIETSQTPCNSPACSNPSTPVLGTSNLRPAIPGPSNVLKRALQPSSSSNQAINTKKQKTNPLLIASSNSKNLSDADKLKIWKHIQSLRIHRQSPGSLSSQTLKELDRLEKLAASNSLGQLTNTLSNAIQLTIKPKNIVLRHVRGIIADRLVKNQDWNNQNL
ncbi:hypothetical protein KEM48_014242 [Puccinia striiformis f. sp. tritici PST-130]|nr:hypothetical protein KEM48_014242 [Puccinia striiformis f. sp. tritici PST-130]